jgi:hypothetical protein
MDENGCGCALGQALMQLGIPEDYLRGMTSLSDVSAKDKTALLEQYGFTSFGYSTTWADQAMGASDHLWVAMHEYVNSPELQKTLIACEKVRLTNAFKDGGHTLTIVRKQKKGKK